MNRLASLVTLTLILALSFVPAHGQALGSIYISNVTGQTGTDTLGVGQEIVWTLNLKNSYTEPMVASNNGFRVYSPDGATWTPIQIAQSGTAFNDAYGANVFAYLAATNSGSGVTGDTVGIGGFDTRFPAVGFPGGFDAPAIQISIPAPGIDATSNGKTICIDSSGYNINTEWLWAFLDGNGGSPVWGPEGGPYGGPVCYTIVDPNAPTESNLIVDPTTLAFNATEGGANPAAQIVDVFSDGDPLDFDISNDSSWLGTSIGSTTTPTDFDVSIFIDGLAPGVYVDTIRVTSVDAANSPQKVVVTLNVAAAVKNLALNPDTLSFIAQEGDANPADQDFEVSEVGGFDIVYTAVETSSWISLNKTGGNTDDTVTVSIDISGLSAGFYVDSIEVDASEADNSPLYEYILLEVTPSFNLEVDPDTVYFTAEMNGPVPNPDTFLVSETGGGTISYSLNETSSWFSLDKSSGDTPDDVEVTVTSTALSVGVHVDSVEVSSGDADNSPIYEYVVITITEPAPTFNLDVIPDTLVFNVVEGSGAIAPAPLGIVETGGGNIVYTIMESTPWFSLSKAGGTTPDAVNVTPDMSALTPGTYYGDVTVASVDADNSPVIATVKLVITALPRFILASPNSPGPNMIAGGPPFSPIKIHVTDSADLGLAYDVTEDVDWLNVMPNSGTTADSFWVIADTIAANALAPGFYQDSVMITSADADNSPVRVLVSLEVLEAPNNPPVIDTIGDQTMNEGDHLDFSFGATDADDDSLHFSVTGLPSFGGFTSDTLNTGFFSFDPGFNDAGVYGITVYVSDGKDTVSESFELTVNDFDPGTEGDTLHVATVPAVPGQQVTVPIDIANSCDLHGLYAPLQWDGDNFVVLDSINWNDSLVGHLTDREIVISNDSNFASLYFNVIAPDLPIAPGHHLLADMYFSISPDAPHGSYAVTTGLTSTTFLRDCGGGQEEIIPVIPGGGGNIVVDTSNVYVCGYVVDEDSLGIWGATVELWPSFPCDGPIQTTTTNGDGAFAFTDFQLGGFDLYAYKWGQDTTTWNDSYHPRDVHVNFGENGIMIVLPAVQQITPVDNWVDYFCDVNTLFGCDLPVGSIVEASDPDGVICGRQFVRDAGVYKFMPVYRDSAGSAEDEGAVTGDNIRFHINGVEALADGNTIYPAAYDTMRVCLAGGERLTKECQLFEGWNLVSWNLNTDTDDIQSVLNSLDGCISVVLGFEQGGLTYVPGMDIFNTLTAVDHLSGYWIKLNTGCNSLMTIEGVSVDQDTPIGLNSGWNLVSYLPNDNHLIEDALFSIAGNFQIAYTYDATPLVFVPGMDSVFNTLNEMMPCFGYWLKTNQAGVLTYPGDEPDRINNYSPTQFVSKDVKNQLVEPTRNWVNLYSHNLTVDGSVVGNGSEVIAHNSDGSIIGHYEMKESGTFGFMPVYADASGENEVGIKKGESFYLTVDGNKTNETFTWTDQGALIEVAALTSSGGIGSILPDAYSLSQNYPNPFNPSTTINFSLPAAGNARIEIFNLLGQLVATPFDGIAEAGEHQVVWDGNNFNGESAATGIYLYRMVVDDNKIVETRKMTLIK